jgi:Nuclease-related domain
MYETMASTAQSKTHGQRLGKRREAQLASDQRTGVYARRKLRDRQRRWLASHWPLIVAAAVLSATAALFIYYFVRPPVAPYLIGGFVSSAAWWTYTVMLRTGGITPQLSGIAAEQWTADSLRPLRRSGWILVNHVMLEYVDVDHVLLGPGGFFAIETKYRSDLAEATPHIGSMIAQSRKSAAGVASRLRTHPSSVRALVVAWGPGANTELPEVVERDGSPCCRALSCGTSSTRCLRWSIQTTCLRPPLRSMTTSEAATRARPQRQAALRGRSISCIGTQLLSRRRCWQRSG